MATSESTESLEKKVEAKVHRLIVVCNGLKLENAALSKKIESLKQQLSENQSELENCRKRLESLACVKASQVTDEEAKRLRNRMLKLEREVEKCISLLNE